MTRGFDANVPARKPRPKISRVISELTSGAVGDADEGKGISTLEESLPLDLPPAGSQGNVTPERAAELPPVSETSPAARPKPVSRPASRGSNGRERIARLRERLEVTAQVPTGAAEPKRAAA